MTQSRKEPMETEREKSLGQINYEAYDGLLYGGEEAPWDSLPEMLREPWELRGVAVGKAATEKAAAEISTLKARVAELEKAVKWYAAPTRTTDELLDDAGAVAEAALRAKSEKGTA